MTKGFQHQAAPASTAFTRSAPAPQHGQKSSCETAQALKLTRALEPRPGH